MINVDSELFRDGLGVKRGGKTARELCSKRRGEAVNVAPIAAIEDDYRAILKDKRKKVSAVVLRYMLDKRIIKGHLYTVYSGTSTFPEERMMTEINVIADVNSKFLEMYDKT